MIVTSFSQKGFHEYGKKFITSFLENWDDEGLTVYYEKGVPSSAPKTDRIKYINLYDFDDFKGFESLVKRSDPLFSGMQAQPNGQPAYNFRYDAGRFYRKAFAICDACKTDNGIVTWIDADVHFTNKIPEGFVSDILGDAYVAHLGREWLYTESGFLAFNTDHPANNMFIPMFYNAYFTGAFKYLGEFHDCYVFDFLRKILRLPSVNLTVNEQSNHPFQESVLGKYMVHLKGPDRKKAGKLLPTDPERLTA